MDNVRLRLYSDLHFEFHLDGGKSFVESMPKNEDAVILAGDIATLAGLELAIQLFCDKYPKVFMVMGNHEFYGACWEDVIEKFDEIGPKFSNFHLLNNSVGEVEGVPVIGTTLWFEKSSAPKHLMNDFKLISRFESWVYEENKKARSFISKWTNPGDVVVTHYLPSYQSVHPDYAGSSLNPFFVCDVENIVRATKPALWLHGHTHSSVDYQLGDTRVVCNPLGYIGREVNPNFKSDLVLEVPRRTSTD